MEEVQSLHLYETAEDVAEAGAKILLDTARKSLSTHGSYGCFVALSGGSTPAAMYKVLQRLDGNDRDLLRQVDYFFGDERSVPNDHGDSNIRLAMEEFLLPLEVPKSRIHLLNGGAVNLEREAQRASKDFGYTVPKNESNGYPELDLVFFGMGPDGHTASLFPGTSALTLEGDDIPVYVPNHVPQMKTWRLTLTYAAINAAKRVVILCTGENKAPVLHNIFDRPDREGRYPIEFIAGQKTEWVLDQAAATMLE